MNKTITAVTILLIFLITSCSLTPETSNPEQKATPAPILETPAIQDNTLRIHSYNPDTLNPIFTQNNANLNMLKLIFEPLVWCGNDMRPIPVLADSWSVSSDSLVWTIHLKQGVQFHDGTALTANDVVATLKAAQTDKSPYKLILEGVTGINSSGNQIQIRLARPQPNFINKLEIPIVKSSKATVLEDFPPVGTGIFVYRQQNNKVIALDANSNWREAAPQIQHIEVHLLPDKNTAVFSYDAKEIDIAPADTVLAGKYIGSQDTNVTFYDTSNLVFLGLNNANKELANPLIRQAISQAINKERLNATVTQSKSRISDTFINPSWYIYDSNAVIYNYNVSEARDKLMQNDTPKQNLSFELLVDDSSELKRSIADFIAESLKHLDINVRIKSTDWDTYESLITKRSYDMFIGEIALSSNADPSFMLMSTDEKNYFQYQSPDMDRIITDWYAARDPQAQLELYQQMQKQYAADLPFISLYYKQTALLINKRVEGDILPLRNNIFYNINEWTVKSKYTVPMP